MPVSTMIRAWEDQALQLTSLGVEVLALRSGWLLGPDAGCLDSIASAKPGSHPVGWIHVDDLVACLERAVRGDLVGVHDVIAPDRPLLQDVITIAASHAHVGSSGGGGPPRRPTPTHSQDPNEKQVDQPQVYNQYPQKVDSSKPRFMFTNWRESFSSDIFSLKVGLNFF